MNVTQDVVGHGRRRTGAVLVVAASMLAGIVVGCGGGDSVSRAETMAAMTTTDVPDQYRRFADDANAVIGAATSWCTDGQREMVSEAVETARVSWSSLLPFWFGPVVERRSRFIIDPTVTNDEVNALLSSDEAIDAELLRDRAGADQRGLDAIDSLLDIAAAGEPSARQCEYALAAADLVAEEADALALEWRDYGPSLGDDDEAANDAAGAIVNEVLFGIGGLANDPDRAVAQAKFDAMRWAMIGDTDRVGDGVEPGGLAPLLDDDVVSQLVDEFDAASSLDADALEQLEVTITTNVVSALGLSIQFSDADGDG